ARKKDPAAFAALVKQLTGTPDAGRQRRAIEALVQLGDPRTPESLLDRLEKDPGDTAPADELLAAVGNFRKPEVADRLLAYFRKNERRRPAAFQALMTISGFDQPIDDPEDERADKTWETKQRPRHPAVLARLMECCFDVGAGELLHG